MLKGGFGTVQDITERKLAEEALRETKDYLENLFNYANAPIIVWDPVFRITRFNHAFERLTGRSASEVIGKKLDILFPEQSREESLAHIQRAVAGERWEVVEIPIQHVDGSVRTVLWNSATLYAPDGKMPIATIAQGQDITERKLAEEALHRRTDELVRSNADLEQFAYIASHDLQEPLRMVSSYVQLLANRYKGKLDQDADDFIGFAHDGATRMQRLINDLLTYSRAGTRELNFGEVNLETVFSQALDNLKMAIKDNRAIITHDPMPVAYGDSDQLIRVFQNLLGNAVKFHGDVPPQVHVAAEISANECVCSVRDNGIGIAPEYSNRIFLLFQRLHPRSEYPGMGIGLAVCKKIVERHGGRIWVESKPGVGSTFYFTVPTMVRKELEMNNHAGKAVDILLVEDNPGDVRLTREALRESKVRNNMFVVEDGVEAMAFLRQQGKYAKAPRPDLIILDLNLPRKSGREVLAEVKCDDSLKLIPIVVMTVSTSEEDILKAYQLNANCYITKPIDFEQFMKITRSIEEFWLTIVKLPPK